MHEILRMGHLIMIAMGTGLAFADYMMLRLIEGEKGPRARALRFARRMLHDFTGAVLALIWVSGLTLLWTQYAVEERTLSALFTVKIGFVVVLTLCYGVIRWSAPGREAAFGETVPRSIGLAAATAWLSALLAICFAVISFTE